MKEKILNNKWYIIAILIFSSLILLLNVYPKKTSTITLTNNYLKVVPSNEFVTGDTIIQKFIAKKNNLSEIGIKVATYQRTSNAVFHIQVKDVVEDRIIFNFHCPSTGAKDNEYFKIFLNTEEKSKGKEYEISIKCITGKEGDSLSFWLGEDNTEKLKCTINNQEEFSSLIINTTYIDITANTLFYLLLIVVFIISIVLIFIFENDINEKVFLKLAIILGIIFAIITPYPHPLDEGTHYFRSFMIANGRFYDDKAKDGEIGGYVSDNFKMFNHKQTSLKSLINDQTPLTDKYNETQTFYSNKYLSSTIPIDHSIAAIGIFIALLLNFNVISTIVIARLFTLAFYIVFSYYAIRNMKYYKTSMFVIVLLPVGMWLAGTISLDPILHGACLLFSSICLKYYFNDNDETKITKADIILLLLTGVMIISVKYLTFTPLLLLFFLIPKENFKSKKSYWYVIITAIMIAIIVILWQFWMLNEFNYVEDRNLAGKVDIKLQIEYIINNPIKALKTYVGSIVNSLFISETIFSYGYANRILAVFSGTMLVLSAIFEQGRYNFDNNIKKKKGLILMTFVFISIVLLMFLAEYLAFTPIGASSIHGFQPRYYIPILILFNIIISFIVNIENKIKNYNKKLIFIMILLNLNCIYGLIIQMFRN